MKRLAANEKGFLLVTAMVVLMLLTLLGLSVMRDSSIELLIAGNDKFHKEAFYSADGSLYMTPKLLTQTRDAGADPVLPVGAPITLYGVGNAPSGGTRFYEEVMGFDTAVDALALDPDYRMQIGLMPVDVDIAHTGAHAMAGGGVEFAAGAGGGGTASAGGVWIGYTLTASGTAPRTISTVSARYRYVPGTTGGLQ